MTHRLSPPRPIVLTAAAAALALSACSCSSGIPANPEVAEQRANDEVRRVVKIAVKNRLARFDSEAAFTSYTDGLARALEERQRQQRRRLGSVAAGAEAPSASPAEEGEAQADADGAGSDESITNTQEAGVDEGGIVKTHGDHLVVLRRGRLFSIDLADGQRRPLSRVDLVPARSGSQYGVWYDEMLVHGDTIVVVGYSYESSGTELVLFDIDHAGQIRPKGRFHLRSNDYYSSRNYASRLLGDKLVFYLPYSIFTTRWERDRVHYDRSLPSVRMALPGADDDDWREIIRATDIVRPVQGTEMPILHTVVTCDLAAPSLSCTAKGILGPYGRTFYVSDEAVYVWVHGGDSPWDDEPAPGSDRPVRAGQPGAVVYRLPLDGQDISAVRVAGAPTDQFSFQETDDALNVLVRAEGGGDWMWSPEVTGGDVALLRMPLPWFSEGLMTAPAAAYTRLPKPQGYSVQNRFVGGHVLYGAGGGWYGPGEAPENRVFVARVADGVTTTLPLSHVVDRIEPMGGSAVVVGSNGHDLVFSSIALGGAPAIVDRLVQEGATQGETRSHGFFFKPQADGTGLLGLPVRSGDADGWEHLVDGSAHVLFLRVQADRFSRVGALRSDRRAAVDDACRVSCVDWYGNARPIFYRGRIFALLGYELVEGSLRDGAIAEVGRTTFLRVLERAL